MAVIDAALVPIGDDLVRIIWLLLTDNDEGAPVDLSNYPDRSAQVFGTWGAGGTVQIQGSNDGTNYHALTDPPGATWSKTADGLSAVAEYTRFIKPVVTVGDGTTDLTCALLARRYSPMRT
jgi:hypothetical protein